MIIVVNAKTRETLRLSRAAFIRALNRCDARTRRGIVSAVKKQAVTR